MEFKKRVINAMSSGVEIKTSYIDKIEVCGMLYKRPEILNHLPKDVVRNIIHYGNLAVSQIIDSSPGGFTILKKLAIPDKSLVPIQLFSVADFNGILTNVSNIINEKDRSVMESILDNDPLNEHTATRLYLTLALTLLFNVSSVRAIEGLNFYKKYNIDTFDTVNIADNLRKVFEISELPDHSIFEN